MNNDIWAEKYGSTPEKVINLMTKEVLSSLTDEEREFFEWHIDPQFESHILEAFLNQELMPGGRIFKYFAAKAEGQEKNLTPANCFTTAIEQDSIEGICDVDKVISRTFKFGGGQGVDNSGLRPRNSPVNNAAEKSTGAASFVHKFDNASKVIGQDGRRGALICLLNIQHPDIEEFCELKFNDKKALDSTNISVKVNNDFMEALNAKEYFNLWWPEKTVEPKNVEVMEVEFIADCYNFPREEYFYVKNDKSFRKKVIYKAVKAQDIWDKICFCAWSSGDPGVIYWDKILADNPWAHGVNPCGEQPLPANCSCALSHINLSKVKDIEYLTKLNYAFLNGLINYSINHNLFPWANQREAAKHFRPIGSGIMGVSEMFINKGAVYGDVKSLILFENMMKTKNETENELNAAYGELHGCKRFNVQVSTAAPTGTLSLLAKTSPGIEPFFSRGFYNLINGEKTWVEYNFPKEKLRFFTSAHQVPIEKRIAIQSIAQKYIDGSVSSTVNLPEKASVEDINYTYMLAWQKGCKGVTVFRDGCKAGAFSLADEGRKEVISGYTVKVPFDSNWYITVNFQGRKPKEVFVNAGKAGADVKANTEAYGKLISLCLQQGVEVEKVIKVLSGLYGQETLIRYGWVIHSQPDAIAKAIGKALVEANGEKLMEVCPKCKEESFVRTGGCGFCEKCGFSKCD